MLIIAVCRYAVVPALAGLLVISAGCASTSSRQSVAAPGPSLAAQAAAQPAASNVPGVRRTATAADGLRDTAQELGSVSQTVGETLAALRELTAAQGDLLAPFDRFLALNQQMDEVDRRLAERGEEMRSRARDYITNWEVEVYGVEDPDLRTQAEARRNRVRADYGKISDATRRLRESMDPFRRQLDDLQAFLSNDLTQSGVRSAAPAVERAQRSGEELQQRIASLVSELDRVAATMIPAASQPAMTGTGTGTGGLDAPVGQQVAPVKRGANK